MRNRHNSCGANGTYRDVCRENQCFALFVASQPPHVEDRLNCLWSLKIVIAPAGKHACNYDVRHPLQAKHCHCLPECFRERAWHEATRRTCLPADTNNTNGSLLVVCHAILLAHPPGEESLPDPSIVTCSGASFVLIWRYISMHVSVTPSAACRGEQPGPVACYSAPQCSATVQRSSALVLRSLSTLRATGSNNSSVTGPTDLHELV